MNSTESLKFAQAHRFLSGILTGIVLTLAALTILHPIVHAFLKLIEYCLIGAVVFFVVHALYRRSKRSRTP